MAPTFYIGAKIIGNKQQIRTPFRLQKCSDYGVLVRQEGLEPPTYWFVASHSIQLSYWRTFQLYNYITPYAFSQVLSTDFDVNLINCSRLPLYLTNISRRRIELNVNDPAVFDPYHAVCHWHYRAVVGDYNYRHSLFTAGLL